MAKLVFSEENYRLLKSLSLFKENYSIEFDDKEFSIYVSDVYELMYDITDLIAMYGMDETRDQCTEYGRELYSLYDEILLLKNNKQADAI